MRIMAEVLIPCGCRERGKQCRGFQMAHRAPWQRIIFYLAPPGRLFMCWRRRKKEGRRDRASPFQGRQQQGTGSARGRPERRQVPLGRINN